MADWAAPEGCHFADPCPGHCSCRVEMSPMVDRNRHPTRMMDLLHPPEGSIGNLPGV
jgi:hypothetical protein